MQWEIIALFAIAAGAKIERLTAEKKDYAKGRLRMMPRDVLVIDK